MCLFCRDGLGFPCPHVLHAAFALGDPCVSPLLIRLAVAAEGFDEFLALLRGEAEGFFHEVFHGGGHRIRIGWMAFAFKLRCTEPGEG
jgi:hypothetical protein